MDRRTFFGTTGAGAAALLTPKLSINDSQAQTHVGPTKIKLGHEARNVTDKALSWLVRYGVEGIGAQPEIKDPARLYSTVEEMKALRDQVEKHGLKLNTINSILLNSTNIDREAHPSIMLAQSPQRDRDIEAFQMQIRNAADAGIPTVKYNMSILGVVRSGTVPGRGGAEYSSWNYAEALKAGEPAPTKAGIVNAEAFWERIDYFLSRVVPVANECKVNIACHPQDPGTPIPKGWRGVDNVLGTVDGLKKLVSMHESPYHGLNFCQGTISEDLDDPNSQLPDVIRYFGRRKKILNVHFRNIRGHRDDFSEVFWDEGSVDFVKMIKVYREVGYDGYLLPDHPIQVPGDQNATDGSFTFAFGYIRGLIQSAQHPA
jgi:mannonate dehydratase